MYQVIYGLWQEEQRKKEERAAAAANRNYEAALSAREYERQKEFAQMGIRWKVRDAQAAGLHPLAALGAAGAGYSPSASIGGSAFSPTEFESGSGQNINRAMTATMDVVERVKLGMSLAMGVMDLKNAQLDNDMKQMQLNQMSKGPGINQPGNEGYVQGLEGQGNAKVITVPLERTAGAKHNSGFEAGAVTGSGMAQMPDGTLVPIKSQDAANRSEEDFLFNIQSFIRNNIVPNFTGGNPPPGYEWDASYQGYRPVAERYPGGKRYKGGLYLKPKLRRLDP